MAEGPIDDAAARYAPAVGTVGVSTPDWTAAIGTLAAVIAVGMAVFTWRASRPKVRLSSAGFDHSPSGSRYDLLLVDLRNTGGGAATLQWVEARIPVSSDEYAVARFETDERPEARGRNRIALVVTPAIRALTDDRPTGWRAEVFQRRRVLLTGELVNGKRTRTRGPSGRDLAELAEIVASGGLSR